MKLIKLDNPHRKKHFDFFKNMNHPHFSITGNVDITKMLSIIKEKKLPFMPTVTWAVSKTGNELPPFRQRIRGNDIVEHTFVHPSVTVDTEASDVFSFCEIKYQPDYHTFLKDAQAAIQRMKTEPSLEDEDHRDDYLFLSSIPWVSFTAITHAMSYHPHDCVPRITWGKYFQQEGKTKMPVSVQAHHALVDGKFVGLFFQHFQELTSSAEAWI